MAAPTFVASGGFTQNATNASNQFTAALDLSAHAGTPDLFLVIHVGFVDSTLQSVDTSTYNGDSATECSGSETTNDATAVSRGIMGVGLWGLASPYTGGTANVVVTMNGGQPTRMMVAWSLWSGVNTSTPFGTPNTNTQEGTSATFTVDPATTADDVAIGSMVASSNAATDVSAGGNELFDVNEQSSFGTDHTGQYLAHDGSSPTTLTWTKGETRQCAGVGVALQGASGSGTTESGGMSIAGEAVATAAGASLASAEANSSAAADGQLAGASLSAAALFMAGGAGLQLDGAAIAASPVNAAGDATVDLEGASEVAGGADVSMAGESSMSMEGASLASADVDSQGAGTGTFVGDDANDVDVYRPALIRKRKKKQPSFDDEEFLQCLKAALPGVTIREVTLQ